MPSRIFLDANAGVSAREEVLETFLRVERQASANPASVHRSGRRAQAVLEEARDEVAGLLRCAPAEVVFTSGATEANHLALAGAARGLAGVLAERPALFSSQAEHPAVLATLRRLQQEGYELSLATLDPYARIDGESLAEKFAAAPLAVAAVQWANNETGAVQPLEPLARRLDAEHLLHVDAVQGIGKLPWEPLLEHASTLALSGHKIGAPKGVGVLRVREQIPLEAVFAGGGQQRGRRGGTESPAFAAAFAHALRLAFEEQADYAERSAACAAELRGVLLDAGLELRENHPPEGEPRLPNTLNFSFPGIDGRALLPACDLEGLDLASGAACSSGAPLPSPVLRASGLGEELAQASCRVSFSANSTPEEAREAGRRLSELLRRLYEHGNR